MYPKSLPPPSPMFARYLPEAKLVAGRIVTALKDCNRSPVFREFVLAELRSHVILFAVLDELRLGGPVSGYANEDVLHQISTLTGGRRVAFSNSNGARYAALLSKPPALPKLIHYPETFERDVFPLGVSRSGPLDIAVERILNALVAGASRMGKSNFLTGLAYAALTHGHQLYLADPQKNTFAPAVWDGAAAAPVASSKADFLQLLSGIHQEMDRREGLFQGVLKPSGFPAQKLEEYNALAERPLPRTFLIADEANTYLVQRGVVETLADLARQSLKYGIHIILAAHNWRGQDVSRELSAQFATRISFGVNDNTSAGGVMDSHEWGRPAMKLVHPGRGILRLDGGRVQEFQAYLMPEKRLADLLKDGQLLAKHRCPLSDEELDLVKLALDENIRPEMELGRMSTDDLIGWGLRVRD